MSGPKAYTMREMKGIVEYLVQHKAYSEIKGRKMWMNFANSSTTIRTWQSLKETFLKRILPDIQNPYYRLTRDQVCSFRQGVDVAAKERRNRLEIQTVSEESISHENQKDTEQPSTSAELRNEVEKTSGEDIKSEKIATRNRSSADTFILDEGSDSRNSGDDPEISKKTTEEPLTGFEEPVTKSLKECLDFEYSEPPSVVRDVLHDFETESESSDKEPQMEIVEVLDSNNTDTNKNSADEDVIVLEDSEGLDNVEFIEEETIIVEGGKEVEIGPTFDHEIITEVASNDMAGIKNWLKDCVQEELVTQTENIVEEAIVEEHIGDVSKNVSHEETEPMVIDDSANILENPNNNEKKKSLDNENNDQNSLSTTADTIIPNNQEGNNTEVTKTLKTNGISDNTIPPKDVTTRKRSTPQDDTAIKKRKLDNGIEKTNGNTTIVTSPPSSNNTEALFEDLKKSNDADAVKFSTIQDAQDVDESPQIKNPCLKSVSLFEEQFNTTKYTDSEDDTPIPKNVEKQSEKTTSVLDKTHEAIKDVTQRDQEQEVTVKNFQGDKNQEESVKDVQGDQKQKKTVEGVKNQEENVKGVLQGGRKQKEAAKDIQDETKQEKAVEKVPQGATMQISDQKQDVTVKHTLKVYQRQYVTMKDAPPDYQKQEVTVTDRPFGDQKQGVPINNSRQDDQESVKLDPAVEKHDKAAKVASPARINKDVIFLKSNSDSDEEQMPLTKKPKERCKHLAQAFGFIPGTSMTATHRRKVLRARNKAKTRLHSCTINESSGWEGSFSDTEMAEEHVSPPRSHRHRHGNRQYKKPDAGQMANDEEGRIFFVFGKKVYPVVNDGKELTYVHYEGSDDETDEWVWRQKYIDEKKKVAEFKKQLEQAKAVSEAGSSRPKSPILADPSRNIPSTSSASKTVQQPMDIDTNKQMDIKQSDGGKILITLSKNSEEKINLEGHWPQVLPIVQQVMSIFYSSSNKLDGVVKENTKEPEIEENVQNKEDISGLTTPVITVVDLATRKVEDLEREIFKEIEERDQEETKQDASNVTKRKSARARKTPSNSSKQSEKSAKQPRKSKPNLQTDNPEDKAQTDDKTKMAEPNETASPSGQARKPSMTLSIADSLSVESITDKNTTEAAKDEINQAKEKVEPTKDKTKKAKDKVELTKDKTNQAKDKVQPTKNRTKQAKDKIEPTKIKTKEAKDKVEPTKDKMEQTENNMTSDKDTDHESVNTVIIGTIEPPVTRSRKSGNETDSSTRSIATRLSSKPEGIRNEENILYKFPPGPKTRKSIRNITPNKSKSSENPHEISQDSSSINSIDSTQGYQDSDASPAKVNATRKKRKVSLVVKRGKLNSRRRSCPSATHDLDSSNSSYFVPNKLKSQYTLDSAVYKSESYEILMENNKQPRKTLEVIDETSKGLEHFQSKESSEYNIVIEIGSSSNVSLPLSPELSLVENLSISREMITNADHPTINETQANDSIVSNIYNQYLITDVDVSIPLMQQDCKLVNTKPNTKTNTKNKGSAKGNVKRPKAPAKSPIKVSELLNKVCTVNMSVNNTLSDSLDRKLRDLLLESAKKISDVNKENLMDVDEAKGESKRKGKKRCSTPRKKCTKKAKAIVAPVIDEHMESCSHGGRNSCPPVITFIPLDENANNSADVQLNTSKKPNTVKKNIIKVKIQRPENTNLKRSIEHLSTVANTSQLSVYTDSGINETASISGLQSTDSVELIHNHSETCLKAHECFSDSLEFVENSKSVSVVSLNSTTSLECELLKVMEDVEKLSGDYRIRSAQDWSEKSSQEIFGTPTDTVYHSPVGLASNCSLITEDLSDETPLTPTKWYLLSDDETNTTNTNMRPEQMTSNTRVTNFSASLKQIFPIICSVPDLSSISEISKENEDSRKGLDTDGDTRSSNK